MERHHITFSKESGPSSELQQHGFLNNQTGGIWTPTTTKCNTANQEFSDLITFSFPYLIGRQRAIKIQGRDTLLYLFFQFKNT